MDEPSIVRDISLGDADVVSQPSEYFQQRRRRCGIGITSERRRGPSFGGIALSDIERIRHSRLACAMEIRGVIVRLQGLASPFAHVTKSVSRFDTMV